MAKDVKNAYPELPVLPFTRTTIATTDVVNYMSGLAVSTAVKRAAYVIFRNESANGQKGINNNYAGFQADGGRRADKWTPIFAGTCVHAENMTGRQRRFLCFRDWKGCFDLLCETVSQRGLYVGGYAHLYAKLHINTDDDWPLAYRREWVIGDDKAEIKPADKASLLSQYADAVQKFP